MSLGEGELRSMVCLDLWRIFVLVEVEWAFNLGCSLEGVGVS